MLASPHRIAREFAATVCFTTFFLITATNTKAESTVSFDAKMHANRPLTALIQGPETSETATPNPFTDYRVDVTFSKDELNIVVPAYFCATTDAADSSADSGNLWKVHFVPPRAGEWTYKIAFRTGEDITVTDEKGEATAYDGATGKIQVTATSSAEDQWSHGKLQATPGGRLRYAVSGKFFLKGGADSPENLLGYQDFDNTLKNPNAKKHKRNQPLHRYEPHVQDWRDGDPVWHDSKGKGLIGALNYLAGKGMNSVYFITMNVTGDGDDVWPWIDPNKRDRFDCSKLAQWQRVFDHMDQLGLCLHIITQETENDHLLDQGKLGRLRKLYYRELIARFAHHQGMIWNLGEEITNSTPNIIDFADYIKAVDPYDNPVVLHTYPDQKEKIYAPLLGVRSIDGLSLQFNGHDWHTIDDVVAGWRQRSADAGNRWIVSVDEPGSAARGVDHDAHEDSNQPKARKTALWSPLFAGGSGVEWYFGYKNPHNDLNCEDWRSRDRIWDQTRFALDFFQQYLPIASMMPSNELINQGDALCLSSSEGVYALYLPNGGSAAIDLSSESGQWTVQWYNPRTGEMATSETESVTASKNVEIGPPPAEQDQDWAVLLRADDKTSSSAQSSTPKEIVVEAEHFASQRHNTLRSWYLVSASSHPRVGKDADPPHIENASGGAYLEILPDTRQSHADVLTNGLNFSNEPGKVAILDYPVHFAEPGKYYVWVRAFSTGSEDNGLHVGLNGKWPESGRRLQWCEGKNSWKWESRQRTEANHCGEPGKIFLNVKDVGLHTVSFSMREDGFEFDQFLLTRERDYKPAN